MKDFVHYFTMRINPFQKYPAMSNKDEMEFWSLKVVHCSVFIVTPFLFQPFWKCVGGLVMFHLTLVLSVTVISIWLMSWKNPRFWNRGERVHQASDPNGQSSSLPQR